MKKFARALLRAYRPQDLSFFSNQVGDSNPLHINPQFASATRFGEIIVPGMLPAIDIDTLTEDLAGPHRITSREVKFLSPIRVHELVRVQVWKGQNSYEGQVFNTVTNKMSSKWKTVISSI